MIFKNRKDAGEKLANEVEKLDLKAPYVVGLPRGGVPVAYEVAKRLNAPLDIVVVRKLGVPFHPEFAFGAIAPNGVKVVDEDTISRLNISDQQIDRIEEKERKEMERRIEKYRGSLDYPDLTDKEVVLIDDGIATGATFEAGIKYAKSLKPKKTVLAVPVSSPDSLNNLKKIVDESICIQAPPGFSAVGQWYEIFDQTSDDKVIKLLEKANN
jgi:predicted phosphoribosyltransferase